MGSFITNMDSVKERIRLLFGQVLHKAVLYHFLRECALHLLNGNQWSLYLKTN